jgi:hypothetical protein
MLPQVGGEGRGAAQGARTWFRPEIGTFMLGTEVNPLPPVANENEATLSAGEERSFSPSERPQTSARPQAVAEGTALAMLRSGLSFLDAAQSSGLPVGRVMTLWTEQARPKP